MKRIGAATLISICVIAGCGGDEEPSSSPPQSPAPAAFGPNELAQTVAFAERYGGGRNYRTICRNVRPYRMFPKRGVAKWLAKGRVTSGALAGLNRGARRAVYEQLLSDCGGFDSRATSVLSGLKQYGGGSLFRETCAEMNTAGVSLQAYARTFLKIVSTTYPFDQMTTDQDLATLERLLKDCPDAGGSPPPKATPVSRQPQVSARQGTQPPTQTQKATKLLKDFGMWDRYSIVDVQQDGGNLLVLTELWPKPANQSAATGICTLLIGDDPPEIDVSGYVTVWNPTADQEIEADECDMWHWDSVYGR